MSDHLSKRYHLLSSSHPTRGFQLIRHVASLNVSDKMYEYRLYWNLVHGVYNSGYRLRMYEYIQSSAAFNKYRHKVIVNMSYRTCGIYLVNQHINDVSWPSLLGIHEIWSGEGGDVTLRYGCPFSALHTKEDLRWIVFYATNKQNFIQVLPVANINKLHRWGRRIEQGVGDSLNLKTIS